MYNNMLLEQFDQLQRSDGSYQGENDNEDMEFTVQKEEWLYFLRKTIRSVMRDHELEALTEDHSLKLIMNAFNGCHMCPVVISTVTKLLSLPFVLECEQYLPAIRQVCFNFKGIWFTRATNKIIKFYNFL